MQIFKRKKGKLKEGKKVQNNELTFLDFSNSIDKAIDPKMNSTFVSICDTNARHLSKIRPKAYYKDAESKNHAYLNYILSLRPNRMMSASQFWQTVAYKYFSENLALIFCEWDFSKINEPLQALYVLDLDKNSVEISEESNEFIFKFKIDGKEYYTDADNLIILTRNADPRTLFGGKNKAIDEVLKLLETNYTGIEQAIKTSSYLRFIIKTANLISDDDKVKRAQQFSKDFLKDNKTGIAYLDASSDIIQIKSQAEYIKENEMQFLERQVFQYLGANEKILTATYTENEWQSYYETTLEPFIIKLEDELTYKLFTKFEVANGDYISISANRLQTASLDTRIKIADKMLKLPVVNPNMICELLYLPKLENGDQDYSTLNFVQSEQQNAYQLGEAPAPATTTQPTTGATETDERQQEKGVEDE